MSDIDSLIGWLAGIMDGEGSMGVYKGYTTCQKGRRQRVRPHAVISVGNTEIGLVKPFADRYGGKVILRDYKTQISEGENFIWTLSATRVTKSNQLIHCILELLPYLRSMKKIQQAICCLKFLRVDSRSYKDFIPQTKTQTEVKVENKTSLEEFFKRE